MPTATADNLMEAMLRLDRDLRGSARLMGRNEARYLTDFYYQIQEFRKASANQVRSASEAEPMKLLEWVFDSSRRLEDDIKKALGEFAGEYRVGQWCMSLCGIGPVITAGLLSHLDIRKAKTVGHFWRFAGLDPTVKWEKKQKRPWNASLKTLCYKIGDSFVKFQNHEGDYYGKMYVERKAWETERNERLLYREQAERELATKTYRKDTEAYKAYIVGKLPLGHLHARARRYVAKLFLSHVHHAMYLDYYGEAPPVPYSFEHLEGDHRHFIPLPAPFPGDSEGKSLRDLLGQP